jgi:hypothetical protein
VQLALGVVLLAELDADLVLTPVQVARRLDVHISTSSGGGTIVADREGYETVHTPAFLL